MSVAKIDKDGTGTIDRSATHRACPILVLAWRGPGPFGPVMVLEPPPLVWCQRVVG